jgi:NAD(P)-dependent dehydrogenase (short-subunit alcohol dehydrogenase family)
MNEAAVTETSYPDGFAFVAGIGAVGRAVAAGIARAGGDVAFTYRTDRSAADLLTREVEGLGAQGLALQLDLTDRAACRAAIDRATEHLGKLHTLVLATGTHIRLVYASQVQDAEWDEAVAGDLTGPFNLVAAALPHLRADGGGSIVGVTSAGLARHPQKDILSTAPKAGVEALLRAIAREEGRHNIRANAVAPGVIDGGQFARWVSEGSVDEAFVDAAKKNNALRRFASPEEIADLVLFLTSSKASFITGQSIAIDGGFSV